MKSTASIVLAVLLFTALSPVALFAFPVVHEGASVLGLLDVCHSSIPALSSSGEMPCVGQHRLVQVPFQTFVYAEPSQMQFPISILASYFDHPPQA